MATFQVTDEFANYLGTAAANMDTHVFKAALTLTAPVKATTTTLSTVTQIAATGGYAVTADINGTWAETGAGTGIWQFTSSAFSWTATGADFASARYIVIYDDTHASDAVVGFVDYGAPFVVTEGNSLTVTPGANGIFRLTVS